MANLSRYMTRQRSAVGSSLRFALALAAAIAVFLPAALPIASAADAPPLVGEMENFQFAPATGPQPAPGPEIGWTDTDGKPVSLGDFKGRVVLLNVWATWCAPCIRELPSLDRLQASLGGETFAVVALNVDRKGKPAADRMLRQLKLHHLAIHLDPKSEAARALGVRVMPSTFLFDAQGREIGKLEGPAAWDAPEAVRLMKYAIAR